MRDWGIGMCYLASLRALVGTQNTDANTDFREELTEFRKPTLIIHGDADEMAPLDSTAKRVHQLVSGSRLEIINGGPHGLPLTGVNAVNQLIFKFVEERIGDSH
jgi:non-heme chloroperoxidase